MTTAVKPSPGKNEFGRLLTKQEILQFHTDGYLGPFTRCDPQEMAGIRQRIEQEVLTTDGPNKASRVHARYMDFRFMYDLIAHRSIVDRVESLLGPDILCWSTNFWIKSPGDGEIPWHQDINYWPIDPPLNVSAWLAIDEATAENSCVRVIPGSHKKMLPEVPDLDAGWTLKADPNGFDAGKAVDMVLQPGQFFLFTERLLHQSNPNRSAQRRMGLSIRMTTPFVKVEQNPTSQLISGHANMMIRGEDSIGINDLADPPAEENGKIEKVSKADS